MEDRKKLEELLNKIKNEENPTFELQKQYIDLFFSTYRQAHMHYGYSAIPEDKILIETMIYTIKKEPKYFMVFPKSKITYEICIEAIRCSKESPGTLMRSIPKKFFDYDLCKECVLKNSKMIRKIPVEFITKEFILDLISCGVEFTRDMNYINECLRIKEQLITNSSAQNDNELIKNEQNKNFQIKLENFGSLFTTNCIEFLLSKNIITLEQLFDVYDNGNLGTVVGENSTYYIEILNTTKLLKCKYLDVDPMIDENSEEPIFDFMRSIGLSTRIAKCFRYYTNYSVAEFFEVIRTNRAYEEFKKIRNLGEKSIVEAINHAKIIIEYHDKQKDDTLDNSRKIDMLDDKECLVSLNAELSRLIEERNRLDKEINCVLVKIQEKVNGENKGGISK